MQNRLNDLGKRSNQLEKSNAIFLNNIPSKHFNIISRKLLVTLPYDFIAITEIVSYTGFPTMEFFNFYVDDPDNINGIIKSNLELREEFAKYSNGKSDMSHILVLSDDDGGSVFMITQDSPEKSTPVIWCDAGDMYHYSINGVFPHPHDEWPSFTDFFEYLVEKEEEKLKEDMKKW